MTMESALTALSDTPASRFIRDTLWVIPWVQTLHIVGIAALITGSAMYAWRLARPHRTAETPAALGERCLPWIWLGLGLLLTTGAVLFVGDPVGNYVNVAFRWKMALLAGGLVLTAGLSRRPAEAGPAGRAAALSFLALLVWCGVVTAGRAIAYLR